MAEKKTIDLIWIRWNPSYFLFSFHFMEHCASDVAKLVFFFIFCSYFLASKRLVQFRAIKFPITPCFHSEESLFLTSVFFFTRIPLVVVFMLLMVAFLVNFMGPNSFLSFFYRYKFALSVDIFNDDLNFKIYIFWSLQPKKK